MTAARWFGESPATLSLYCQGLNQSSSGTAKNAALINLHLATGQIGRAGRGPFQPHRPAERDGRARSRRPRDPARRASRPRRTPRIAPRWRSSGAWTAFPQARQDRGRDVRGAARRRRSSMVWIACTNPAQSLPDLPNVRAALERAELVVLQEAYRDTETAPFADVLLPATTWGEKEGTVTNSERRISRVRAAVRAPGEARHDWAIAVRLRARRLESDALRPGEADAVPVRHRPKRSGTSIARRRAAATSTSPAFRTRCSSATARSSGRFRKARRSGKARLYADGGFPTPSGQARFFAGAYSPVAERVDARYPLRLTTGRLRDQWHGMSRTGNVAQLFGHAPEPRLGDESRRHDAPRPRRRRARARGVAARRDARDRARRRGPAQRPGVPADALGQALPRRARERGHEHAHQSRVRSRCRTSRSSSTPR